MSYIYYSLKMLTIDSADISIKKGYLEIREAAELDFPGVMEVERLAFEEDDEAILVEKILKDTTAQPTISLLAYFQEQPVGHILYTKATIESHEDLSAYILAPLAVVPEFQQQGIGQKLMEAGDKVLLEMGTDLVFVLGHPSYYPKNGFINDAKSHGFPPPYLIPSENADAWMFKTLKDVNRKYFGRVKCCEALAKPEYWRE